MSDIFQKVPPHSIEAEQSLIGSMMLSEDAIVAAMEWFLLLTFIKAPTELFMKVFFFVFRA